MGFRCWWLIFLFVAMAGSADALDRCEAHVRDVRIEHTKYFGLQYPYWYALGQLKQESGCRAGVTAFDAGMGIAQFMPKTSRYIQSLMGETLDPYNPKHAIRMQAFYMAKIHRMENWTDRLWISYQIYNGGAPTLKAESRRAGATDWASMRKVCQRKKINLCDVNYDYSVKVAKYGNQYRRGADGMRFW
ncbi:MAG: transglycosylase SLT domain-containing protein [Syntrophus sp. (in: bacteria)]